MSDDLKQLGFRYDGPDEDSPTTHWLEEIDAEGNGTEKYHSFEVPDAIPRAWWERLRAWLAENNWDFEILDKMQEIEKEAEG
jgi:hypothetical protein